MRARYRRTPPGTHLYTCMKGEFNHVCGTDRAARSLPRARSSPAHAPRLGWKRFSNVLAPA
ncbi:hypothetical protein DIE11_19870 [Burkholderia sp. Bp9012]|nr:hypothetical protein DIE11_19870 [Burkholderia sp. Bp9012]RQZ65321.1 hypothetical protein DIE08_22880 [Burkholderia sp. Bp9004]